MTPEEFRQVAVVFEAARQLAPPDRPAYIGQACAEAPRVRREVESLLAHHEDDSQALTGMVAHAAVKGAAASVLEELRGPGALAAHDADLPAVPQHIGAYRIVRQISVGGMGVVYEARQENPSRSVALKMLRPGLASPAQLKRFQREGQLLGELRHQGIAQIFEAGTADTPAGPQPYFAMEFIDGVSITRFARRENLDVRARLRLLASVCDAVEFAHSHGIIHRDLKPANILVNRAGQAKVLDFGVARVSDADLALTTLHTDANQIVGTLAYMSPEQVAGSPAVDARSDVYALGVILHELLVGRLPYAVDNLPLAQAARTIQESEHTRLSSINREFRGDIETIVAKALEKEKERRYDGAGALAADIRRFLADEPIQARPQSALYQLHKFAKRNKALVIALVALFVALAAGFAGTGAGLVRARKAGRLALDRLDEAERQTRIAEAVNEFLNDDLLALADPENSPDRDLTVRAALDAAAASIAERFQDEPLVEAGIRVTLGRTYRNLGVYDQAETHLTRAIDLRKQYLGLEHADTLKALNHLAILFDLRGQFDLAEPLHRSLLDARMRRFGPEHPDTLATMNNLGLMLTDAGRYEAAEPLLRAAYQTRERILPENHADRLVSANNLVSLYWQQEKYRQALPFYQQVLEARRKTLGPDHPQTLTSMDNLATCLAFLHRLAEAEALNKSALEGARRILGLEHPQTVMALNNLGSIYLQQKRFELAEPVLAEAVQTMRRTRQGHWSIGSALSNYGLCLRRLNRLGEAEAAWLEAHTILEAGLGPTHDRTTTVATHLASLYEQQGDAAQAAAWCARAAQLSPPESGTARER